MEIKKPSPWLKNSIEIAEDNKRTSSILPFTPQETLAVHAVNKNVPMLQ